MAVAFEQDDVGTGARRGDRRGAASWPAAYDQHIGVAVHRDLPHRLIDRLPIARSHGSPRCQFI